VFEHADIIAPNMIVIVAMETLKERNTPHEPMPDRIAGFLAVDGPVMALVLSIIAIQYMAGGAARGPIQPNSFSPLCSYMTPEAFSPQEIIHKGFGAIGMRYRFRQRFQGTVGRVFRWVSRLLSAP